MPGEQTPESWIGETVEISFPMSSGSVSGEILEVNDRGVVVRQTHTHEAGALGWTESRTESEHHTFMPWSSIQWLMRTVDVRELDN